MAIYDRAADTVTGSIPLSEPAPNAEVDNWGVSPLGNFIVTQTKRPWSTGGEQIPSDINVWTPEGQYLRTAPGGSGHVDYCLDADGEEVVFYIGLKYGSNDKVGQTWRLDGSMGSETVDQFDDEIVGWGTHVSCASTLRPGYAIVSTFPHQTPSNYDGFPRWNHAFVVRLDGSRGIGVIAGVHHNNGSEGAAYDRSSFAVPNRDLSAVWFSAHWDAEPGAMIHSFVARPAIVD